MRRSPAFWPDSGALGGPRIQFNTFTILSLMHGFRTMLTSSIVRLSWCSGGLLTLTPWSWFWCPSLSWIWISMIMIQGCLLGFLIEFWNYHLLRSTRRRGKCCQILFLIQIEVETQPRCPPICYVQKDGLGTNFMITNLWQPIDWQKGTFDGSP